MVLLSARIQIIHSLVCCITVMSLNAAEVIKGSEYVPSDITFSFPVNKIVKDALDDTLFIGARDAGADVFALSGLHPSMPRVQPLAPEKVSLNNTPDQNNPIYNQGIALLDIMETQDKRRCPIMVTEDDLTRVRLIRDFTNFKNMSVFSTDPLIDANKEITQEIVGLTGFRGSVSAAFAAVAPNYTGIFGDNGSAFTVLTYDQFEQIIPAECDKPETKKTIFAFRQFSTTAFNRTIDQASAIQAPVTSFSNNVVMSWNRFVQRGYVGFQVIGGAASNDGARSIIIGDIAQNGIAILRQFAPASAFDSAGDQIIGGLGASIPLSVHHVESMETSTGLSYLIVHGGNGTPAETVRSVYALPIINTANRNAGIVDPALQGTLASKNSGVFTFYDGFTPSRFLRRRFIQPATTPADTPRSTDVAARVGGGPIEQGTIEAITVSSDAVIASVSEVGSYGSCPTGMFISRTIYNSDGVISGWTPWQRIGGAAESVFDAELSISSGNLTYFTGDSYTSVNTIKRTGWGLGSNPGLGEFVEQLNILYTPNIGGVQGLIDIPLGTPGLDGVSLMIATGFASVTLTETGSQTQYESYEKIDCPNMGDFATNARVFEDGTISENLPTFIRMLTIQGGALCSVGPVITAAVGVNTNTNQGYLFVGGSRGLAVLSTSSGEGWSSIPGLGQNFVGLTKGMSFKLLNNYKFVRKLVVDGNFLYVVSASRVDRIDLSTGPTFTATTIASCESLVFDKNDTILDGIFSGKLAVLATTKGVFRTSNGNNVMLIKSDQNKYWTTLLVPPEIVPPQEFFVSSTTGLPTDFAQKNGGMFQLLSAYLGSNRARVNRFAVKDVSTAPIDDTTIAPLPDGDVEGVLGSFLTFPGYRSSFTTDGALTLSTIGRALLISPYVKTLFYRDGHVAPLGDSNGTLIDQVLRSSASGSWLVAGDFGIRVNE